MRLTRDEILLVTCILLALVAGAIIKHYRDQARLLGPATRYQSPASAPRE
jgi:hypothetical protein